MGSVPVTLRSSLVAYLLVVHLGLGGLVFWHLRARPWWFLGLELALVLSLLVGLALARRSGLPRELLRTGAELVRDESFGSRLSPTADPDAAELVALVNGMMERLRRERLRVQEREQLLGELVQASSAAFLTLDHEDRIELANPAAERILAASGADLVGRPISAIDHRLARELAELGAGEGRMVNLEGRRVHATRGLFYDRGFPRSFFLVEELTEELRATERTAYDRLIRMISHEVKNSVGAVASVLQSAASIAADASAERWPRAARALGVAEERLQSLDEFVDGFAEVVRLPPPDRRPVELGNLVDDLLLLVGPELASRKVVARWVLRPDDPPPVSADKNQLEQVLVNVLRNALEAIDADGELALSLERRDGTVRLSIADTGPGIPEPVRRQLFVPFVSTKRDGRGLGLTLVREILDGHGVVYGLENRPEGGAVFTVDLPVADEA